MLPRAPRTQCCACAARAHLHWRLLGAPPRVFALTLLWSADRVHSGAQLAALLRLRARQSFLRYVRDDMGQVVW